MNSTANDARPPSNFQLRLFTAAIGLPLVGALAWLGGWPFAIAAGVVAALAAVEFGHGWLFPSMALRAVFPQLLNFAVSGLAVAWVHAEPRALWAALALAGFASVAGYAPGRFFGPRKPWRVQAWALLYVGVLASALVLVRDLENGRSWVFLGLFATFATDTGAYAVGRLIGRHKLAPRISPKKTWEGAAGGYAAGAGAVLGLNALFDTGLSAAEMLPFALAMPVLSQAGDLFESWMKRRMGVKDASGLLPGHGGFLDRLDSILFVMPVLYVFLRWWAPGAS